MGLEDLEYILELFKEENTKKENQIIKELISENKCQHEYIPLFTSVCCKYCGKKQEEKNEDN